MSANPAHPLSPASRRSPQLSSHDLPDLPDLPPLPPDFFTDAPEDPGATSAPDLAPADLHLHPEPPPPIEPRPLAAASPARVLRLAPRIRVLRAAAAAAPICLYESASQIHSRVSAAPAAAIIEELLSAEEIALWHGLPRAGKSILTLRALIDLALGDSPVWDDPRFQIPTPRKVLYYTEEDGAGMVDQRLETLMSGRCKPAPLAALDGNLRIVVRKGLSFDRPDAQGQAAILSSITSWKAEVVAFDPLRSFTSHCDQGPSDLAPVTQFLRKILRETSCKAIIIGHHDVKPPRDGVDLRGRAHRASGGGIFSIADSPINFERRDDISPVFCFPSLFKGRILTPKAFSILFDTLTVPGGLRFNVSEASEASPIDQQIVAFIAENPGSVSRAVRDAVRGDTTRISARVADLVSRGVIIQLPGAGRRLLHYLPEDCPATQPVEVEPTQQTTT